MTAKWSLSDGQLTKVTHKTTQILDPWSSVWKSSTLSTTLLGWIFRKHQSVKPYSNNDTWHLHHIKSQVHLLSWFLWAIWSYMITCHTNYYYHSFPLTVFYCVHLITMLLNADLSLDGHHNPNDMVTNKVVKTRWLELRGTVAFRKKNGWNKGLFCLVVTA